MRHDATSCDSPSHSSHLDTLNTLTDQTPYHTMLQILLLQVTPELNKSSHSFVSFALFHPFLRLSSLQSLHSFSSVPLVFSHPQPTSNKSSIIVQCNIILCNIIVFKYFSYNFHDCLHQNWRNK